MNNITVPHEIIKDNRNKEAYELSYIINFYNEEEKINMLFDSLQRQKDKQAVELILIDDNSSDSSLQTVLKKVSQMEYDYLLISNSTNVGLRRARALGVEYATGEILTTLDAHLSLEEQFTQRIKEEFKKNEKIAAVGVTVLPYGDKWFHKGREVHKQLTYKWRKNKKIEYASGGAVAYRKAALLDIGGLRTSDISVDRFTSIELIRKGWKVKVLDDVTVRHYGPQDFPSFVKKYTSRRSIRSQKGLISERKELLLSKVFLLKLAPLLFLILVSGSILALYYTNNLLVLSYFLKGVSLFLFGCILIIYVLSYLMSHNLVKSVYATVLALIHMLILSIRAFGALIGLLGSSNTKKEVKK